MLGPPDDVSRFLSLMRAQVAVSVLQIAGPMRLVHIHRRSKPMTNLFSLSMLQALQERGFRVPFASERLSQSVKAQDILSEAAFRRGNVGVLNPEQPMLNAPMPMQAMDVDIAVHEVGLSVLVERSEFVRLLVKQVGFAVSYPYHSEEDHQEQNERFYRERQPCRAHPPGAPAAAHPPRTRVRICGARRY